MSRILLLLDHRENRRLLMEVLSSRAEVVIPETDAALADDFDLCLLDGPALERLWQQVEARKNREAPIFLPILLVTARPDVGLATRHLWHSVDELIITPIERVELQARVEILLRARHASVQSETERAMSEAQSREVNAILESIDTAVMITDRTGRILRANTALARMMRRPLAKVLGKTFAELTGMTFTVPWQQQAWEQAKTTKRHGVSMTFAFAPERGTTYWDVVVTPILQPDGQVGSVLKAYTEVSEYVIARQIVEEERARLRTILETLPVGVFIVDAAGGILSANDASRRIWGGPIPDVHTVAQYRVFNGWLKNSDRPLEPEEWAAARVLRQGSTILDDEVDIQRFDGARGTILNSATPMRDESGCVTGAIWVMQDITERKHIEAERKRAYAEMQRRTAELEATIAGIADGLVIYNTTGEIVLMNDAARELLGFTEEECHEPILARWSHRHVSTPDGELFPLEQLPASRALRGERVQGVVIRVECPPLGRSVWISASAGPILTPDHQSLGAVANYADITSLHSLQEQQKSLLQMVSHDLRAPLTVIKGHEQVAASMLEEQGINGMIQQSLAAIDRSVSRMDLMIQDLVDVTRWEGGQLELKRETVELPRYLTDLLQRISLSIDTTRIQVEMSAELPPVSADYARLERILVNLLTNALKYSAPGTPVLIHLQPRDSEVVIAITDQGTGIPPEAIPHLFDRFYRVPGERKAEGIGLGLYITKVLVEAHGLSAEAGTAKVGGRIWVESEIGKGSTFFFSLPVAPEKG